MHDHPTTAKKYKNKRRMSVFLLYGLKNWGGGGWKGFPGPSPCLGIAKTNRIIVPARASSTWTLISNGNRTEWSPIRSVIIRVITKSDDRAAGVRFAIMSMITDRIGRLEVLLPINHKNYNFREKKNSQVMKERANLY